MKTLAVSVILVSLTVPAYARNRHIDLAKAATAAPVELSVKVLPEGRTTATRLFSQVRKSAARSRRNCVGASAVVDNRSARLVVIPAVGSVRGGGGTFFRSDITFVNWNSDDQRVRFLYLPNGNAAGTITAEAILPGDRPPFTVADFVGTQLLTSGLGSLIIVPVDASGQFDENGAIDAYSRIYTPQPNTTSGTVSQPFAGADPDHLSGEYEAIVLGLRQDADYRTNFGIVNLFDTPLEFSVLVLPESAPPGTPLTEVFVTLPPLSMVQQALPAGSAGPISLIVGVETEVPDDDQAWTTYASSTDNVTGDGWVSIGAAILDDEGLDDREQ